MKVFVGVERDGEVTALRRLADLGQDDRVGGAGKLATALRPLVPDRLADKLAERTAS